MIEFQDCSQMIVTASSIESTLCWFCDHHQHRGKQSNQNLALSN